MEEYRMKWHDFDRNGKIDGRDYFLMDLLLNSEEEEKENEDIFDEDEAEDSDDDLW